jgi:hypothetical protein
MLSQITRGQAVTDIIGGLYLGSAALVAAAMVIACVVVAQYRSIAPGRTTAMDHVSGIRASALSWAHLQRRSGFTRSCQKYVCGSTCRLDVHAREPKAQRAGPRSRPFASTRLGEP